MVRSKAVLRLPYHGMVYHAMVRHGMVRAEAALRGAPRDEVGER